MNVEFPKIIIITGHYGSGKTNIAVNIALFLAAKGEKVTVVDMDIVNPYFRTADFKELFKSNNIDLRTPLYANSNVDIPALNYDLAGITTQDGYIIIDVGGDDAGATALGRYSNVFLKRSDVKMFCVINKYRYVTQDISEEVQLLHDIEAVSKIKCSALINNSNLGKATTAETVSDSKEYVEKISEVLEIPFAFTAVKKEFLNSIENGFEIEVFVKPLWDE